MTKTELASRLLGAIMLYGPGDLDEALDCGVSDQDMANDLQVKIWRGINAARLNGGAVDIMAVKAEMDCDPGNTTKLSMLADLVDQIDDPVRIQGTANTLVGMRPKCVEDQPTVRLMTEADYPSTFWVRRRAGLHGLEDPGTPKLALGFDEHGGVYVAGHGMTPITPAAMSEHYEYSVGRRTWNRAHIMLPPKGELSAREALEWFKRGVPVKWFNHHPEQQRWILCDKSCMFQPGYAYSLVRKDEKMDAR